MATNFYLESRTDKNGDAPIRISVTIGGARFVTSTQLKISPDKWNADKQQAKKGSANARGITYNTINKVLRDMSSHFADLESECLAQNAKLDTEALRRDFNANFGKKPGAKEEKAADMTFFECFDAFVKQESAQNNWTYRMVQKFKTLRNHLQGYDASLSFDSLTESKLSGFVDYLRIERGMLNSTNAKQIALLKWFLRWATEKKHNGNVEFASFSPKLRTSAKVVVFLEWPELMRVLNYEIPADGTIVPLKDADGNAYEKTMHDASAIAKTRDIFCFCCFTSLRYSDASNLKWSNIIGEKMTITTIKTADTITIELNKYALAILDKYRAEANSGAFVFPHMTNQRMNIYLKDLCEFVGINQPVTQTHYSGNNRIEETLPKFELVGTHCGRRTFICNALMLGIPAEIVMKWTGHSDYKAMKPYIAIADAAKAKAMDLFNNI